MSDSEVILSLVGYLMLGIFTGTCVHVLDNLRNWTRTEADEFVLVFLSGVGWPIAWAIAASHFIAVRVIRWFINDG